MYRMLRRASGAGHGQSGSGRAARESFHGAKRTERLMVLGTVKAPVTRLQARSRCLHRQKSFPRHHHPHPQRLRLLEQ